MTFAESLQSLPLVKVPEKTSREAKLELAGECLFHLLAKDVTGMSDVPRDTQVRIEMALELWNIARHSMR